MGLIENFFFLRSPHEQRIVYARQSTLRFNLKWNRLDFPLLCLKRTRAAWFSYLQNNKALRHV